MEEEIDSEKRIREEMRESFEKEVLDLRERFYADKNLLKAEIRFFISTQIIYQIKVWFFAKKLTNFFQYF